MGVRIPRALVHFAWSYLVRHAWQSILMVLAIAIGVAVMVGIDIANETARRAFDLSSAAVNGKTTHTITAGSQGVDEAVYFALRKAGLGVPMTPLIRNYASSPQLGGELVQVLGIDPFSVGPFRDYFGGEGQVPIEELTEFLTQPGGMLISQELAERYNLQSGDKIQLEVDGKLKEGKVAGILRPADNLSRRGLRDIVLMDISSAQEITGKRGKIERIDLILPEEAGELNERIQRIDTIRRINTIRAMLPAGTVLSEIASQSSTAKEMTAAFRLNLTALSLLAMVVGIFLIYNTMTFSVVQRRPVFGALRCLGVTRREAFTIVMIEAALVGMVGAGLGVLLGILMGRGTVGLVSQTINDLFFVLSVRDTPVPATSLVKGAILGTVVTIGTAAFPAWEAASIPPRSALSRSGLEAKARRAIALAAIGGAILTLAGVGVLAIPSKNLALSFGGTFMVTIGLAMSTPLVTVAAMGGVTGLTGRAWGALGRMAPREVIKSISRTAIAVAALMTAVAVTIGVNLMIGSFRSTVNTWMNQVLHGDVYVTVPGADIGGPSQSLDPRVVAALENFPGIERVDLLQTATVDSPLGPVQVSANNNPNDGMEQIYAATDYPVEEIWAAVQKGSVLVSEPLANRLNLPRSGGKIALYTDQGLVSFPIAGIYYDYASSQGNMIFHMDVYRKYWDDERVAAAALLLEPGADPTAKSDELKASLAPYQKLIIRPNQALRDDTLEIFDRTFAITGALQLMTVIVAFVGILSAMMSLQLDKERQHGILKAIGTTSRQLWGLIALETGLMGGVAGLFAMPVGVALATILIYIINKRSFGWTLQMELTPEPFIQALAVSIAAALLAGIYPAWRIARRNTSEAIRFE